MPGIGYMDPVESALPALPRRPLADEGITGTSGSCDAEGYTNDQEPAGGQLSEGDKVPGRPPKKCVDDISEKEKLRKVARIDSLHHLCH